MLHSDALWVFGLNKIAKARWQKELGPTSPEMLRNIRSNLQSFKTPLNSEQLKRHDLLQEKLLPYHAAATGITPKNIPGIGAGSLMGSPHVAPETGTQLRSMFTPKNLKEKIVGSLNYMGLKIPGNLPRRTSDAPLTRAIGAHELAEATMQKTLGDYRGNLFASHLGPSAVVAENLGVQNPHVRNFMGLVRQYHPEDAAVQRILRQHGMVGNYVPPLGGRTMRSVERAVEKIPVSGQALAARISTGAKLAPKNLKQLRPVETIGKILSAIPHPKTQDIGKMIREKMTEISTRPSRFTGMASNTVRDYMKHFAR